MGEWKQGDEIAGTAIIWMSEIVPMFGDDGMCRGQETGHQSGGNLVFHISRA